MQEALTALVSSLHRFRGDASLSSWAYVVARNGCARRRRRDSRHQSLEHGDGEGVPELRDPGAGPESAAERGELRQALDRAIGALPASLRDVLVLRDVEGLSAAQVGKRLGLGERAVKSRLHRARLSLRELLAPHLAADAPARNPKCPDVARMFSRFLEGELDAPTCSRLEAHVAECAGCGAACSALREALGACAAWKHSPAPPQVLSAVRAALREVVAASGAGRRTRSRASLPPRS
jgi:RNA polymerase sigma-70 factor (ECF subfamily)